MKRPMPGPRSPPSISSARSLRLGADERHGDRTVEHGLSSIGYDDEGVAAQAFDLVAGGLLVGYQLDRRIAAEAALGRSNGCAFASSALMAPLQRMANVSLAHGGPDGPTTEELIAGVDHGIYVIGDKSWSIDMQRHNFQFTGQRFFAIENGRVVGQLRDVAYQSRTTDFWGSLVGLGGESTYLLGGAFNCGKGQPGQAAPVSHGCPSGPVRRRERVERPGGVRPMTPAGRLVPAADVVEEALAAASSGIETIVIVEERSDIDVRFANNTVTSNGVRRDRHVTVAQHRRRRCRRTRRRCWRRAAPPISPKLVADAERAAAGAPVADDATPLIEGTGAARGFEVPPELGDLSVFAPVLIDLREALDRARRDGHVLAGFAARELATTYLGTSRGIRRRHVQPTGSIELVARAGDGSASSWTSRGTPDFTDVVFAEIGGHCPHPPRARPPPRRPRRRALRGVVASRRRGRPRTSIWRRRRAGAKARTGARSSPTRPVGPVLVNRSATSHSRSQAIRRVLASLVPTSWSPRAPASTSRSSTTAHRSRQRVG